MNGILNKMIVNRSMNRPRPVYVVNSRLPVYTVTYGDRLGDVVTGLFTRIAPKMLPIGEEVALKTIGLLRHKIADNIGTGVFNVAKDKLTSLIKKKIKIDYNLQMKNVI